MLFLAEHHAIRFIANGTLVRISMEDDIAAGCSGGHVKGGGFVKRSACLQRIRCDKRLEKRFSGRLVLERSRSNGGLFSCFPARCMLNGYETTRGRGRLFF